MLGSAYSDEAAEFVAGHLADLWDQGLEALRTQFQAAERTYSCPLVLDLDRNGVITSAQQSSEVYFDHDVNGFAERTGWVSPTDGLLVRDLDGNGLIDHGGELFGNHTVLPNGMKAANGFEALKALDGNGDRWIDQLDPAWSTLKIWIDRNSNAVAEQGEMVSLSEAGVRRLGVTYATSDIVDLHGNRHLQLGEFQSSDGTLKSMNDVWFQVDQARTRWLHTLTLDDDLLLLPDLKGMGKVPDLRQAIAADESGELRLLLERWIQGSTLQREALIDPLIFRWVGVSSGQSVAGSDAIDGRLVVMERLLGQSFRQGWTDPRPIGQAARMLHLAYENFRLQLENLLTLQTDALPILKWLVSPDGDIHSRPSGQTLKLIADYLDTGFFESSDYLGLYRLTRSLQSLGESGTLVLAALQESLISEPVKGGLFRRLASEHRLQHGSDQANHLSGTDGQDLLDGGAGDDLLHGGAGRDWLVAGSGNDSLNGGIGDDVYVIGQGGERKEISDTDFVSGNRDVVSFPTLRSQDITSIERHGSHLILRDSRAGQLKVENYFASEVHRIEAFRFANGVIWGDGHLRDRVAVSGATAGNDTLGGFNDMANRIKGLDGHDLLYGGIFNDALTGGNGNDTLHGADGDDILDGGAGHDALHGGRGRDRLISGSGNDTLVGGEGDDTYVIVRSGGIKTIMDHEPNAVVNNDLVTFSNLRSTDLLSTRRQGAHLELRFSTKDQLIVSNYFLSRDYGIEAFRFSNGVTFGEADIHALILPF
ncbi:hemolysin-type calcium binding protein [Cyanobium sp. Copco_Reservoir_LC18]|nr:hemolysin-type calcium binding protein [Cyanobium sp. Copco_Reservoir_LC18]